MRVGVIFGAIRNPHEPPVAGEGGGARKAQIGAALENEIARANLCDCPYRTERTVSGGRIDPLQAVPSPHLLLERRERDLGLARVLWTPAPAQRRPARTSAAAGTRVQGRVDNGGRGLLTKKPD